MNSTGRLNMRHAFFHSLTFLLPVLAFCGACLNRYASAAEDRPHVVMIVSDDLNDWLGCLEGHPQARTPNLDALAGRGMLFANAHCQAPLCNSSRTSILTGKRPSTTGVYALEPWVKNVPSLKDCETLPEMFHRNGYDVRLGGKIFHGVPAPKDRAQYASAWGPGGIGVRPPKKIVPVATPQGNHPLVDWGTFPHTDEQKGDFQLATWAVEQLQSRSDKPQFLAAGFFLPHVPCYATQQWFDLYPQESLVLPKILDADRQDIPEFAWRLHWKLPEPRLSWMRKNQQLANLVQAYLACISFMDDQVGRIVRAVEESPEADRTIIVFWSDHGWHLGEKGVTGKNTLWAESTRVPLIFAGPGIAKGRCDEPVELLDLFPTFSELCHVPAPQGLEGHSLVPQLHDANAKREWPAITTQSPGNHSVVTRDWRYIRYADGSEELYDHRSDPEEWTNLASHPEQAARKAELAGMLPKSSASPAPGSKSRLLEYRDGNWYWENELVRPEDLDD